jgi:hypothetical protein
MKHAEFALQLARHADLGVVFEFGDTRIHHDYHLTEVLHTAVDALDCGGARDHWAETVLQLVAPEHDNGGSYLRAGKVIDILQRAQAHVALPDDSEVLLEFRMAGASAAQRFHVTAVQPGASGQLRVLSEGARTQCKAAVRSPAAGAATKACCSTGLGADSSSAATACCAPGAAAKQGRVSQGCCA